MLKAGLNGTHGNNHADVCRSRQLLKAVNILPGLSQSQIDRDAVLIRAYGRGTAVLIDRDRESQAKSLPAAHKC